MVQGARVNGVGHTYLEFSRCPLSAVNSNPEILSRRLLFFMYFTVGSY